MIWPSLIAEAKQPLFPIPEMWFEEASQKCTITVNEDDSDYIYETASIQEYRGRHFDGHRNALHRLLDDHEVTVRPLGPDTQAAAMEVIDAWSQGHTAKMQQSDSTICKEAVSMAQELRLDGLVFEVDGRPTGLLIGTPLTAEMYCIMFKKTSCQLKGLSPYMFQAAARSIGSKYRYLNWEQDLGEEGLRKAKESFHPLRKAKKGAVKLASMI